MNTYNNTIAEMLSDELLQTTNIYIEVYKLCRRSNAYFLDTGPENGHMVSGGGGTLPKMSIFERFMHQFIISSSSTNYVDNDICVIYS